MAKFRFSLQTLLRYREDAEQAARDEMMMRLSRQHQEERKLDDLRNRRNATSVEMVGMQQEDNAYAELIYYRIYLDRLDYEIEHSLMRLVKLRSEAEMQRKVLVEASKKRKTLASLRDKKMKEFNFAQEKAFQQEIDEAVVLRHKRPEEASFDF